MRLLSRGVTALVGAVAASIAMPALAAPAFADAPAPGTCSLVTDAPVATVAAPGGWTVADAHQWRSGGVSVSTDGTSALTASRDGDFPLADAATLTASFAGTPAATPTVALTVTFNDPDATDQTAVLTASGATDASSAWTLEGSVDPAIAAAAPSDTSAAGWADAFPDARVETVTYAFAAGADPADATLTSVTADCVRYTFDLADAHAPTLVLDHAAKVGQALTVAASGWAPEPDATTTTWQVGSADAVTAATITPATADAGKALTVTVTGTKPGYRDATSALHTTIASADFAGSPNPVVSGTVRVGARVTASLGTWSPKPTAVAYQWRVDGKNVAGATASSFVPRAADRGHQLSVAVTATLPGYTTLVRYSAAKPVAYGVFSAAKPTISGSSQVGSKLTAHRGTWAPAASTYAYQWLRSGKTIKGATKSTYKVVSADAGKSISVRVTGKATGWTTKVVTSSSVKATVPFKTTHAPTITGTTRVSSTLTAHVTAWSPKASLHYQWNRNGKAIAGATKSTYKLAKADHGTKITVTVKGTRSGYTTKSKTSKPTSSIAWPKGVTTPKITKQPAWAATTMNSKVTFRVTATGGSLHYQWQTSPDGTHGWTNLAGKTSSSLTVTATAGVSLHHYRVVVSNVVKSVTSKDAALAILSSQTAPFGPQNAFLLDSWSAALGYTEDLGPSATAGAEVIGATFFACYGGPGTIAASSVLSAKVKVGSASYAGSLTVGGLDDEPGRSTFSTGQCGYFTVSASVPVSVLNSDAFDQAVWAFTDTTSGYALIQYVRVG